MRQVGQTPQAVEMTPAFMEQMRHHLEAGGWSWGDVKRSYEKGVTLL